MKKLFKDKRGSSLVLVLVTMSFIILLAGAIITMTITNIWLKASQKKTQENFYSTDSVLDSVAAGIQNDSSKASADAYADALSGYTASLTAADDALTKKYTKTYLSAMIAVLSGGNDVYADGTTSYHFSDDVLKSYLTPQEVGSYIGDASGNNSMELRGESLVLKNISVYKKDNSYETTLTTDICIDVPLVSTDAHSEYLDYAILADDQIFIDGINKMAAINGNIYAGTVNRNVDDNHSAAGIRSRQGIRITNKSTLEVNAQYIISRGDLALSDRGTVTINDNGVGTAELWVENITTDAAAYANGGGNSVNITGECNVADDMELNGKNDKATLSGKYFGYNYNSDYSSANNMTVDASQSSAISINGQENSLDLSGLSTLILAGRTFISKKANTLPQATALSQAGMVNSDVELGGSLSVKSSQLAYFVPSDYVMPVSRINGTYTLPADLPGEGIVHPDGGDEASWLFFNADGTIYAFDYESYNNYVMPDASVYSTELQKTGDYSMIANQNAFDVRDYIGSGNKTTVPTTAPDGSVVNQDTYTYTYHNASPLKVYYKYDSHASNHAIRYFYLNFDKTKDAAASGNTSRKASIFYAVFHDGSPQQTGVYDDIDDRYLSNNGVLINETSDRILLSSGDILYSKAGQNRMQVKLQNVDPLADEILFRFAKTKSKEYMSRQLALVPDYSDASSSTLWRLTELNDNDLSKSGMNGSAKVSNLFNKLVDESQLSTQQVDVKTVDGEQVAFVTSSSDVTWPLAAPNNNVTNGIIITSKKVTLNGNFNGLIISGDDVELGATGITVNAKKKLVENALALDKADANPMIYNLLSKYFRKSVDATIGTSASTDMDNVSFENWTKN